MEELAGAKLDKQNITHSSRPSVASLNEKELKDTGEPRSQIRGLELDKTNHSNS